MKLSVYKNWIHYEKVKDRLIFSKGIEKTRILKYNIDLTYI